MLADSGISQYDGGGVAGTDFHADTAIVPADRLSRQALEAQAKDMAIEDALYALDKALQHGTITSEAYLKQVGLNTHMNIHDLGCYCAMSITDS